MNRRTKSVFPGPPLTGPSSIRTKPDCCLNTSSIAGCPWPSLQRALAVLQRLVPWWSVPPGEGSQRAHSGEGPDQGSGQEPGPSTLLIRDQPWSCFLAGKLLQFLLSASLDPVPKHLSLTTVQICPEPRTVELRVGSV